MTKMNDGRSAKVLKLVHNGEVTGRECKVCKVMKPFSDFGKDVHGYMQKKAKCRDCDIKHQREVNYPKDLRGGSNKNRPDRMLRFYGVTYEHVVHILDEQHGMCANKACGKEISLTAPRGLGKAFIDHDHTTGKFRALLCMMCNLTLGKIENERHIVLGLMDYITKHS